MMWNKQIVETSFLYGRTDPAFSLIITYAFEILSLAVVHTYLRFLLRSMP
jgi:hypothetical protein